MKDIKPSFLKEAKLVHLKKENARLKMLLRGAKTVIVLSGLAEDNQNFIKSVDEVLGD